MELFTGEHLRFEVGNVLERVFRGLGAAVEAVGDGGVEVLQEEVEDVVVDAPVFLDLLQAEEAHLGAVFGDAPGEVCAAADADGVDAECGEETCDSVKMVSEGIDGFSSRHLQMHLAVAKSSLGQHVLSYPTNLGRSRHSQLSILIILSVSQEIISMDKNSDMAIKFHKLASVVESPKSDTYLYARCSK